MRIHFHPTLRRAIAAGFLGCLVFAAAVSPACAEITSDEAIKKANEAFKALREKRFDDAMALFKEAVEKERTYEPTVDDFLSEAGSQLSAKPPNYDLARQFVQKAIAKKPDSADAYYLRARIFRELDQPGLAQKDLEKALDLKPDHPEAADDLWELLDGQRQYNRAAKLFKALSDKNPDNVWLLYYSAEAYRKSESPVQAAEAFDRLVRLSPDRLRFHTEYVEVIGTAPALRVYEKLVDEKPRPMVKLMLANLYLEEVKGEKEETKNQKHEKAGKLLTQVIQAGELDAETRFNVADLLGRAERYEESADQFNRVLRSNRLSPKDRLNVLFKCGMMLVKARKGEQAIDQLEEYLMQHRQISPGRLPSGGVYFWLGQAYQLIGNKAKAELNYREYQGRLGRDIDPEIADILSKIYIEDHNYRSAAELLKEAVHQHPKALALQLRYAHVLFDLNKWGLCVDQIETAGLLDDEKYTLEARLLLVQAYLEDRQPDRAMTHLRKLEGKASWNAEADALMGRALLQDNRPEAALKYLEKALEGRTDDVPLKLRYAEALNIAGRPDDAMRLYQEVTNVGDPALAATGWVELGDMEMKTAKGLPRTESIPHLRRAVEHYNQAFSLVRSEKVLAKRGEAERDLSQAEAELSARRELMKNYLYMGGLAVAFAIPVALFWVYYRRQWAMRCYQQVVDLERDLKELIRWRVRVSWGSRWDDLASEPFQGRVDYKYLKRKAAEKHTDDVLDVANFGHLVGIVDSGWEVLGFAKLSVPGTRALTIAGLSYVGNCRNAIFHSSELEELQRPADRRGARKQRTRRGAGRRILDSIKWALTGFGLLGAGRLGKHLDRQVKTSIKAIRKNFDFGMRATPQAEESSSIVAEVEAIYVPDNAVYTKQQTPPDRGRRNE